MSGKCIPKKTWRIHSDQNWYPEARSHTSLLKNIVYMPMISVKVMKYGLFF